MGPDRPEFFRVTFDADLDEMFRRGRGLVAAWRSLEAGPGADDEDQGQRARVLLHIIRVAPWWLWAELVAYLARGFAPQAEEPLQWMARLLHDDVLWRGLAVVRPVFKALVHADYEFASRYCPMGSHEERLTGALMATIVSNLEVVRGTVQEKGKEMYGEPVQLAFAYDDLSARGREKHTGADFAVLLFVNLPGGNRPHISAAVFQAKKIRPEGQARTARIDLDQLRAIQRFAGPAAYYCFYEADPQRCLPPVVAGADRVSQAAQGRAQQDEAAFDVVGNACCSLAEFLIFGMLPGLEGREMSSLADAAAFLRSGPVEEPAPELAPRRRLVIAIGSTREEVRDVAELLYGE